MEIDNDKQKSNNTDHDELMAQFKRILSEDPEKAEELLRKSTNIPAKTPDLEKQSDFSNDIGTQLMKARPEDLYTFAKLLGVKRIFMPENIRTSHYTTRFDLDGAEIPTIFINDTDRKWVVNHLVDRFRSIGSDLFQKTAGKKKTYREILYICARKLKAIPTNREFYKYPDIRSEKIDQSKDASRQLIRIEALPTPFMERRILEKSLVGIWSNMNGADKKKYIGSVLKEVDSNAELPEVEKILIRKKLEEAYSRETSQDNSNTSGDSEKLRDAAAGSVPFILLSLGQASGFGIYLAATTAVGAITSILGITLPFAFYTSLTSGISILLGPVGWISAGIIALSVMNRPKYNQLYPAICLIAQIRNRPEIHIKKETE